MRRVMPAVIAGFVLLSGLSMGPARAAEVSKAGELGFQQVANCLQSRNDLAVLLVVDESGSLGSTDPNDVRAKLLANLVRTLGRQAGTPTATGVRKIDLAVSLFSSDYEPLVEWTPLDPKSSEDIATKLEADVPGRDTGESTNHPAAISGAKNQMLALADRPGQERPCELVIMFTDGVLDVGGSAADDQAAATKMCRKGGIVDGIRRDGINLVNVMLFDPKASEENPAEKQAGRNLLKAAAEGTGGNRTCGTVPIPAEGYARGAYLEGDVDRLALLFASLLPRSSGTTPVDLTGSPVKVEIDPGIVTFTVVGFAPKGISLQSPGGKTIRIAQGGSSPGAKAYWDFSTVTAGVAVGDGDYGTWTITRPGQSDELTVFLDAGLGLQLDDTQLTAGEQTQVRGQVVRLRSKEPTDLSVFRGVTMTASVDGVSASAPQVDDNGAFTGTVTPNGDGTIATIEVALQLVTESGQKLRPIVRQFRVPVSLPKEFPTFQPQPLVLTPLVGDKGKAEGTLTSTGSAEGSSTVCVKPIRWTAADDPANYRSSLKDECFELAVSEQNDLPVTVTAQDAQDERVSGVIPLELTTATGTKRTIEIPVTFAATRPVNEAVRVGVVAALAALALLIPLILLYLFNRHLAKFRPPDGLVSAALPVVVSRSGVRSAQQVTAVVGASGGLHERESQGRELFTLPMSKLRIIPPVSKPVREMAGPDGSRLRTRIPVSFFGSPSALVLAEPGRRVFSSRAPYVNDGGTSAPLSFGMADVWYASISDAELIEGSSDDGVAGVLSVFVPPRGQGDSAEDVAEHVRSFQHFGAVLDQLREAAIADAAKSRDSTAEVAGAGGQTGPSAARPPGPGGPSPTSGRPGGPGARPPSSSRPPGPVGAPQDPRSAGPSGSPQPPGSHSGNPPAGPSGPPGSPGSTAGAPGSARPPGPGGGPPGPGRPPSGPGPNRPPGPGG